MKIRWGLVALAALGLVGPSSAFGIDWQIVSLEPKNEASSVRDKVNTTWAAELQSATILPVGQARMELSTERTLDPDGTLADDKTVGSGLLIRRESDPSKWFGSYSTLAFAFPGTYYFQYSYLVTQNSDDTVPYCGVPIGSSATMCLYVSPIMFFQVGAPSPYRFLSVAAAKAKALSVVKVRFAAKNPKVDWCRRFGPIRVTCRVSWRLRSGKKDARTVVMYRYLNRVGVTRIKR